MSAAAKASERPKAEPARDVEAARQVFRLEAEGIQSLARALDGALGPEFTRAIDIIHAASGRVIVTGMGKSGHVARKIAATMASVGTPALFVHPGEASHGDLGMIAKNDVVIALSNSGKTAELVDLVEYCKRFAIPLIAFTSRSNSALAEAAQVTLLLPGAAEACPLGLAPTTSTTMMLALGDALAVTLLKRNGFTHEDFQVLHPGGKLVGRTLMRVSDLMDTGDEIPLASPSMNMSEVIPIMTAKRHGCCGIVADDGRLVGIITDGDLRRHMDEKLLTRLAAEVMTKNPLTIRPEAFAAEALGMMNARKITTLFAVRDGRPAGFLYMHALLRAGVA